MSEVFEEVTGVVEQVPRFPVHQGHHAGGPRRAARGELALLRDSHDRSLGREGIPMVLALVTAVDGVAAVPSAADGAVREDGASVAGQMDRFATALAPSGRDGDMARVVLAMQAAAFADFGQEPVAAVAP